LIDLLIAHAAELVTCRTGPRGAIGPGLAQLEVIADGAVAIDRGRIVEVGPTRQLARRHHARRVLQVRGRLVSPGLVDPHSHLIFAGTRHEEWEDRVLGRAIPPGRLTGIRYTVARTRRASAAVLRAQALADLDTMLAHGTTTVEVKSGYGLDRDTELRLLRVAASLRHPVCTVLTYLGAHVVPTEYLDRRDAYVDLVIDTMPEARRHAEYCDLCCDPNCFTTDECRRMAKAALALGYRLRVHADQNGPVGAAELAAELGASSADHLDHVSPAGMRAMARRGTVGVLVPGVTHHLMEMTPRPDGRRLLPAQSPFWPRLVRRMIAAGIRLALAADYNPGSSPTQSMQAVMQLAARLYRLGYAETWHMSTINAAWALDRGEDRGSLEAGKRADVVVWTVPEHGMVINRFGVNLVDIVMKDGRVVVERGVPV
jgi:imidazolonepropionase